MMKNMKLGEIAQVINSIRNTINTDKTEYTYNTLTLTKEADTIKTQKQLNRKYLLQKRRHHTKTITTIHSKTNNRKHTKPDNNIKLCNNTPERQIHTRNSNILPQQ